MAEQTPILLWFRRDLRTSDHPALHAALQSDRPVIPVFLHDDLTATLGAAPKFRLHHGVACLASTLEKKGSRLILRSGEDAAEMLSALARETGAGAVYCTRLYDPQSVERDRNVRDRLDSEGVNFKVFAGHLLFEPDSVETGAGSYYKVFTPFWKAVKNRDVPTPYAAPDRIPAPDKWPQSDSLSDWGLPAEMRRGAKVVRRFVQLGEEAAQDRLTHFIEDIVADYKTTRDMPGVDGTSNLSENLSLGEISPRQCWHAGQRAIEEGKTGAETFVKELVWREFAYHLMHHTPHILTRNWREEWEAFPWKTDPEAPDVLAWKQGRTGIPFVDAAMREMYVTGRMHNRGRMIVASFLTKHLMVDWRVGQEWFDECLIDWDPASNALGWQWTAGSGPDASPFFRIFNPETQLDKFDPDRAYTHRWIAEGQDDPPEDALAFFDAIPRSWNLQPSDPYPAPIVSLSEGREAALAAYKGRDF